MSPAAGAKTRIRWFSATGEAGFCIHATLAAAGVLYQVGRVTGDSVCFDSRGSRIRAWVTGRKAWADLERWVTRTTHVTPHTVARHLGLEASDVANHPRVFEVNGERELVVELRSPNLGPSDAIYFMLLVISGGSDLRARGSRDRRILATLHGRFGLDGRRAGHVCGHVRCR
jgi:hypothetical protein